MYNIIKMKITILLPVYNDEKYIRKTLESIKNQSHPDFICFIGFNGTIDSSKEIARKTTLGDERFTIIDFGEEKGKSITLNKLLSKVETERFCLIDGDDLWHPQKLESQIILANNYDIIGTLASYIDDHDHIFHHLRLDEDSESIREKMYYGQNQIINSSCMVKKEDATSIGGWDPNTEGLEDFDFWIRLCNSGKSFYNIQKYLVYHRVHVNSNFNSKKLPYTTHDIIKKNKK